MAVLRMKSAPARAAEMVQALRALMRTARAEKGLVACDLCMEAETPAALRYEERWQTVEDFEEQVRSPRYTRLLALMESALEPPLLEFHFISETRGLEYVAAIRGQS